MARKAKKEEPKDTSSEAHIWLDRIASRERFREKMASTYRWEDFVNEYKGIWPKALTDKGINPLNYVFTYVKTELAGMYLRDPHVEVNPTKTSSIQSARMKELELNDWMRKIKFKREIKKCILDGKTVGHAWFKQGLSAQFGQNEDGTERINSESFFGYRTSYDHITFNAESLEPGVDSRWICHEYWIPEEEAKKKYPTLKFPASVLQGDKEQKYEFGAGDVLMVKFYELWDIVNLKVLLLAEGVNQVLETKPWKYFTPEKKPFFPFSYLRFNFTNDEPYGLPDVFFFEHLILEKTKLRWILSEHVKKFGRQIVTEKNNFDDIAKQAYADGDSGDLIEVTDISKIAPIPYPPAQGDIYPLEDRYDQDIINISRQSPTDRGATTKTHTRALGELMAMREGVKESKQEQLDVLEDFIEDIAQKHIWITQLFADVPHFIKATGLDPAFIEEYVKKRPSASKPGAYDNANGFTVTKEDLEGDCDVDVQAGSTAPLDRDNKLRQIIELLQYQPNLGFAPGGPVAGAIGKIIGEELDMPEILQAIEQEIKFQQDQQAAMAEQQAQAAQMQAAESAAEIQVKSEQVAAKQSQVQIDALRAIHEMQQPKETKVKES